MTTGIRPLTTEIRSLKPGNRSLTTKIRSLNSDHSLIELYSKNILQESIKFGRNFNQHIRILYLK